MYRRLREGNFRGEAPPIPQNRGEEEDGEENGEIARMRMAYTHTEMLHCEKGTSIEIHESTNPWREREVRDTLRGISKHGAMWSTDSCEME